jgi:hypothetical protein
MLFYPRSSIVIPLDRIFFPPYRLARSNPMHEDMEVASDGMYDANTVDLALRVEGNVAKRPCL